jgi:hypothetical protein
MEREITPKDKFKSEIPESSSTVTSSFSRSSLARLRRLLRLIPNRRLRQHVSQSNVPHQ